MLMKKTLLIAVFGAVVLAASAAHAFTTGGFTNPYGVAVDTRTNFIFVSNVNGSLDAKDDNGFISRLRGDGSIENLRFVDASMKGIQLDAPKGMAVVGTTLYVCDIDKLRAFDTTYGNHLFDVNFGNLPVQHFYDVKLGPDNALYVADGPGNRIYRVDIQRQHEVTTLVSGDSLGQPHSVAWFAAKQAYTVGGWSSGQVTAYNRSGKIRPLPAVFLRTLEGMDADDKGNIYIASTGLSAIYRIDMGFALQSFNTGIDSPSGIAFHKAGSEIITASFNGNTVESIEISPEKIGEVPADKMLPAPAPSVPAAPAAPVKTEPQAPAPAETAKVPAASAAPAAQPSAPQQEQKPAETAAPRPEAKPQAEPPAAPEQKPSPFLKPQKSAPDQQLPPGPKRATPEQPPEDQESAE